MYKILGAAIAGLTITCASAQSAPYAGQQQREIKSLPADEVSGLLAGEGLGLAKAAELNGYPGPAHVLEHAQALGLSPQQAASSKALLDAHKARARRLGAAVVDAERALDQAFAGGQIDESALSLLTARIGELQASLREEHLRTHLQQTALLDKEQVRRYAELRGYTPAIPNGAGQARHRHPG
jgi:hypothetical protein